MFLIAPGTERLARCDGAERDHQASDEIEDHCRRVFLDSIGEGRWSLHSEVCAVGRNDIAGTVVLKSTFRTNDIREGTSDQTRTKGQKDDDETRDWAT